jgi:hypothetical protein
VEDDLMRTAPGAFAALSLLLVVAYGPKPLASEQPPAVSTASLDDREWILVRLGEVAAPLGAGGRPATIQFDPIAGRAAGFAGCNRYSAGYSLAGGGLTFGPAISTKMACADPTLILSGSGGPLAGFRAP